MRRIMFMVLLTATAMFLFSPVRQALSKETGSAGPLIGKWKITHRPVDAAGKPCPFLPETMEISKNNTIVMSNVPGMKMPYKTELTAEEVEAFAKKSEIYKGKQLLLVKPNPRMDWLSTPMVYIYSITKGVLSINVKGWETATFKRVK
jgi:hypothetical protein